MTAYQIPPENIFDGVELHGVVPSRCHRWAAGASYDAQTRTCAPRFRAPELEGLRGPWRLLNTD